MFEYGFPTYWTTLKKLIWLYGIKLKDKFKELVVKGIPPLTLLNALANKIISLTQYGKCEQPSGIWNTAITQYGKCEQRNLPSGYTELVYLESNGTQYINTGLGVTENIRAKVTFAFTSTTASTRRVFGKIAGSSSTAFNFREYTSFYWFGSNSITAGTDTDKHTVEFRTDGKVYKDNVEIGAKGTFGSSSTGSIYLFAELTDGGNINYGSVRIYSYTQYDGNNVVLNLIPAKRNSDNELGMYDTVSGSFFINNGTGDFVAGNATTPTPDRPMDLWCNNGRVIAGNCISNIPDGQGTFVTPSELTTTRIYKAFPSLIVDRSYTVAVTGTGWQIIVQRKVPGASTGANLSGWVTTYDFTPEDGYVYGIAIRKGDMTITPADFDGTLTLDTTDGKPWAAGTLEVLTVRGKNILDATQNVALKCVGATGAEYAVGPLYGHTAFIPVQPNTTYSWSGLGMVSSVAVVRGAMYSDANFSSFVASFYGQGSLTGSFTTTAETRFVVFNVRIAEKTQQLELGSAATAYEPYTVQTITNLPMLLGVGDYKDEAEIINGLLTHKVGVYVITGAEGWSKYNDVFFCNDAISPADLNTACVCTSYVGIKGSVAISSMSDGQIKTGTSSNASRLFIRDDSCATAADLKAKFAAMFAAGTPPILVYPLVTATTEQTTAYPQLCNKLYTIADVDAEVDNISVVFTQGTQTIPSPYSQLPIICNNGELKWNGTSVVTDGTPEVLWVSPNYGQTFTLSDEVPNYAGNQNRVGTILTNLPAGTYTVKKGGVSVTIFLYYKVGGVKSPEYVTIGDDGVVFTLDGEGDIYIYGTASATVALLANLTLEVYNTTAQTINDVSNLLAVGNYKDTEEFIAGIKTGKVGVMVLDGTENFYVSTGDTYGVAIDRNKYPVSYVDAVPVLCTHLPFSSSSSTSQTDVICNRSGNYGIRFLFNEKIMALAETKVAAAKAFISAEYAKGTPVMVVYVKVTETIEQTMPHDLSLVKGTNVVSITAEVPDIELEVKYKGK